jgi:hypothetical protein
MKEYYDHIIERISIETQPIDIEDCNISTDEAFHMVEFLQKVLSDLREKFLGCKSLGIKDEICFFKEMKPQILSSLLYFNKVYAIEIKCPNGSDIIRKNHYENELGSLTYFFNRHLDFYQYYRSNSTHFDECYFTRSKPNIRLCVDSSQFIRDPEFSTGYDYKVAKILSNEMLRIYLNKKLQDIDKQSVILNQGMYAGKNSIRWTAPKSAAIEMGYSLHASGILNKGNISIQEIMLFLQKAFNIDLGDYYRTYVAIKSRKKDRTAFLKQLIEILERKMDEEL